MSTLNSESLGIPACRFCKHYTPEGRRGGSCSALQVNVDGNWQSCSISESVFESKFFEVTGEFSSKDMVQDRNCPKAN